MYVINIGRRTRQYKIGKDHMITCRHTELELDHSCMQDRSIISLSTKSERVHTGDGFTVKSCLPSRTHCKKNRVVLTELGYLS